MNILETITQQRQKELRTLKIFIACSLVGSMLLHAGAAITNVSAFWQPPPALDDQETEIIVEEVPTEETPVEELPIPEPEQAVIEPPPEVQDVALAPPPLAPDSQAPTPLGEDAPSNQPPAPNADPVKAMTGETADKDSGAVQAGGGPITSKDGKGDGFGFGKLPTGFNPFGTSAGSPSGTPGGVVGGTPGGTGTTTATRGTPPAVPPPAGTPKLICLECPKPKFRGSEGQPRVTYDIAPDGRVINVRLRQSSGNPDTDRETLETLQKWRFKPESVPEGGRSNVKVRVTFEEDGSTFQRQNEQRRRQDTERRQIAEEQQREVAPVSRPPASAATEAPVTKPAPPAPEVPVAKPAYEPPPAPAYEPPPAPAYEPPPAPAYEPPPAPAYEPPPAPAYEPPPAPAYEPPPAPVEAPPAGN
jgi:TonB family protein